MPEKKTKRMVYNGIRFREGKDNDWYETDDGKIVVIHMSVIKDHDVIMLEYPDFSEEKLNNEELYVECKCGTVIRSQMFICGPCYIRDLEAQNERSKDEVIRINKAILEREALIQKALREWNSYLEKEADK